MSAEQKEKWLVHETYTDDLENASVTDCPFTDSRAMAARGSI